MSNVEQAQLRKVSASWLGYAQLLALFGILGSIGIGYAAAQVESYYGTETNGATFFLVTLACVVTVLFYLAPIFLLTRVVQGLAAVLEQVSATSTQPPPPPPR